jgi:thiamine biosynthesis lipoprotein
MAADAWATALMVLGSSEGAAMAARIGLDALLLDRVEGGLRPTRVGRLFEPTPSCANGIERKPLQRLS